MFAGTCVVWFVWLFSVSDIRCYWRMDRELAFLLAMQPGLAKADRYWWLIF